MSRNGWFQRVPGCSRGVLAKVPEHSRGFQPVREDCRQFQKVLSGPTAPVMPKIMTWRKKVLFIFFSSLSKFLLIGMKFNYFFEVIR